VAGPATVAELLIDCEEDRTLRGGAGWHAAGGRSGALGRWEPVRCRIPPRTTSTGNSSICASNGGVIELTRRSVKGVSGMSRRSSAPTSLARQLDS
jgi:hypothetical protein